ncbi:MAG: DegT/DnrJ/EryC1/StrS family aminotransferase [Muribaculaceae bacterium]|nr:DegT/DnrJ/EryC1/StrS family aminotransferase [Muribaculaceae bacterium]
MNTRYTFLDLGKVNAPYMNRIEDALLRVARSGRYVGGPEVEELEANLARLEGEGFHAVGLSNGLDALRLTLRAWVVMGKLKEGDEVIVPANTYVASVLAIVDAGLTPVLAEPSEQTLNLDTERLNEYLTPRTRAIMPVHLYGRVCWDDDLKRFAEDNGLLILEDNAQAIGAIAIADGLHGSRATGALGHAGAFSFYPTKNLGALGDAGAVVTPDAELASTVRALANYGSDRRYHNIYAGFNCRLDPVQAAVLNAKFPNLEIENLRRRAVAEIYRTQITNPAIVLPVDRTPGKDHVFHQFVVRMKNRDSFLRYLEENGIGYDIHYAVPAHLQPCFATMPHAPLPITEKLASEIVSLPISSCTSPTDASEIASLLNRF